MHKETQEKNCVSLHVYTQNPLFSVRLSTVCTGLSTAFVYNFYLCRGLSTSLCRKKWLVYKDFTQLSTCYAQIVDNFTNNYPHLSTPLYIGAGAHTSAQEKAP